MKSKRILFLALLIGCLAFAGCTSAAKDGAQTESSDAIVATDYSQSAHWLNVPTEITKEVDVFYLYPSAWAKVNADDPIICEIDNPVMLQQSKLAFDRQATAFENSANIFAPYYRQDDAGSTLAMAFEEQQDIVKGVPLTDAMAAFEYYLDHYNNGRPFILASHSQGSNVMIYILQDYMKEHPDVYKRMVAAYVLGYSITDDYLAANPDLKFATGSGDTGVIISYNTQAPTIEGSDGVVLPTAHVINPISWTTAETVAPAADNLGSLQLNSDGSVVKNADGSPALVTPAGIDALLEVWPIFEAFQAVYVSKGLLLDAEKNVSAPSPTGTSAGATATARPARKRARTARRG